MPRTLVGSEFAGYQIEAMAGQGGMGVVYRATDIALDRTVALKLITPALAEHAGFRRRFITESKVAASLDHPNVIPIYQAGELDGVLFLAMRFVAGEDLRSLIACEGPVDPVRATQLIAQVASALDAAHARGVVHRDIKPANVLLGEGDHVYLTDFGLTKRAAMSSDSTQTGQLVGTIDYVSPEQIRGDVVAAYTDIYALGCLLFQLVTGQVPFPVDTDEGKLWAHLSQPPPAASECSPGAPRAMDSVLEQAMRKEPSERYKSAGEFAQAALAAVRLTEDADVGETRVPAHAAAWEPGEPARSSRRALVKRELVAPFNLIVLAGVLLAGVVLAVGFGYHVFPLILLLALGVYAMAVALSCVEEGRRREALDGYGAAPPPIAPPGLDPAMFAPPIRSLLTTSVEKGARVRKAIEKADLPYTDASREVEKLLSAIERTARRAQLLHEGLEEAPPKAVARRLAQVKKRKDGSRDELVGALSEQLEVQNGLDDQLQRFYGEMNRMLIELDTVRGRVASASASAGPETQRRVAAEVRELREDMGSVADGMAAAYAEGTGMPPPPLARQLEEPQAFW